MSEELDFWDQELLVGLTDAQMLFVRAYIETDDHKKAAEIAWPGCVANSRGMSVLNKPEIREAVARTRAVILNCVGMGKADIVRELECLARFNPKDYVHAGGLPKRLDELTESQARALGDVEYSIDEQGRIVPVKLKTPKIEALKILAKATGMLDKGAAEPPAVYKFDLNFGTPAVEKGVRVTAGNHVIDIKTSDG